MLRHRRAPPVESSCRIAGSVTGMRTAPTRRAGPLRSRRCSAGTGRWRSAPVPAGRRSIARCNAGSADTGTRSECDRGEVPGVFGVGQAVDIRFQAVGGEGDQQVVQGGPAAQDEIAGGAGICCSARCRVQSACNCTALSSTRQRREGWVSVHRRAPGPLDGDISLRSDPSAPCLRFDRAVHAPRTGLLRAGVGLRVTRRSQCRSRPGDAAGVRCRAHPTGEPLQGDRAGMAVSGIVNHGACMRSVSSARRRGSVTLYAWPGRRGHSSPSGLPGRSRQPGRRRRARRVAAASLPPFAVQNTISCRSPRGTLQASRVPLRDRSQREAPPWWSARWRRLARPLRRLVSPMPVPFR